MKNVLMRNLSEEQSQLIDQVLKLTNEKTGSKAILSALADYVKMKADIENYKSDEMSKYILMMSKVKTEMRELEISVNAVRSAVGRCEMDLSY